MIRACAATLLAIGLATPADAQNVDGYLELARQYAAGDADKATAALSTWSRREIGSAADWADQSASVHDLLAVAMLHTELANSIIDTQADAAQFHLNVADGTLTAASTRFGEIGRASCRERV